MHNAVFRARTTGRFIGTLYDNMKYLEKIHTEKSEGKSTWTEKS